jgi:hypothetical protein
MLVRNGGRACSGAFVAALVILSGMYPNSAGAAKLVKPATSRECIVLDGLLTQLTEQIHSKVVALPLPSQMTKDAREFYAASLPQEPEPEADKVYFIPLEESGAILTYVAQGCISSSMLIPPEYADEVRRAFIGQEV